MGDIKVFNDAGLNDPFDTVTSYSGRVARISTFIGDLQTLTDTVANNTQAVNNMIQGADPNMDTFAEISDQLDPQDFLDALNG